MIWSQEKERPREHTHTFSLRGASLLRSRGGLAVLLPAAKDVLVLVGAVEGSPLAAGAAVEALWVCGSGVVCEQSVMTMNPEDDANETTACAPIYDFVVESDQVLTPLYMQ